MSVSTRIRTSSVAISLFLLFAGIGQPAPLLQSLDTVDVSSGGSPTITGNLGGGAVGSGSITDNLVVTINFGEVCPINTNPIVKAVVPVGIRSSGHWVLNVSISSFSGGADPDSVQLSDIGFGVRNLRSLGAKASPCGAQTTVIQAPFNNDPAAAVSIGPSGRAVYPSSLGNVSGSTAIMTGGELSKNKKVNPRENNGYAFDAIFTVVPQFYTPGSATVTVTFQIQAIQGPDC